MKPILAANHGSEKPTQQSVRFFSQDQTKRNPQDDRKRNTIATLETTEFVKICRQTALQFAGDVAVQPVQFKTNGPSHLGSQGPTLTRSASQSPKRTCWLHRQQVIGEKHLRIDANEI